MEFNLDQIVKAPFAEKDWFKRLLPIFAVNVLYYILVEGSNLFTTLTRFSFYTSINYTTRFNDFTNYAAPYGTSFLVSCIVLIAVFAYLAYQIFYATGFNLSVTQSVMNDEKPVIPEPNKFSKFAKLGGSMFVINLIYGLIFGCILFIGVVFFVLLGSSMKGHDAQTILAVLGFGAISFYALLAILYGIFVFPATTYILVKTNSLAEALNITKVWAVIKGAAGQLLLLFAFEIIIAIIAGTLGFMAIFTCCFIIIIAPIITTLMQIYLHYIMGIVFKEIKSKGL